MQKQGERERIAAALQRKTAEAEAFKKYITEHPQNLEKIGQELTTKQWWGFRTIQPTKQAVEREAQKRTSQGFASWQKEHPIQLPVQQTPSLSKRISSWWSDLKWRPVGNATDYSIVPVH